MNRETRRYLMLERAMLELDDEGEGELANRLRDVMDVLWSRRLTASDRESLNAREIPAEGTLDGWVIS